MTRQQKTRKRKGKDLDEVVEDLRPEKKAKLLNQPLDADLPGDGQFYCVQCVRHFINETCLENHCKTKPHKKRVRQLQVQPYTQKEAEAAGGVGSYVEFEGVSSVNQMKKSKYDSGIVC